MKFLEKCVSLLVTITDILTLNPFQRPLTAQTSSKSLEGSADSPHITDGYVTFPPPHVKDPTDDDFTCEYPQMSAGDWQPCSTPNDRSCWLKHKNGSRFDIHTNYEKFKPAGRVREYFLNVTRAELNLDGVNMKHGVVFDDGTNRPKYPGPWIRACWGDKIRVHVRNNLDKYNGTTIHWHGIRQLGTMQMDGVNAVTQCPIAPGDSYTYEFDTMQYGTSWYHSHYSLQYADGLVGPLTIYGPSSANWDEAKSPTLFTDWNHRSAFEEFSALQWEGKIPVQDSILMNGLGNFAGMNGKRRYTLTFKPGRRYLLRLINTSVDTSFVFAIDNHTLEVMSTDFVPITPYKTDHVVVGIGQRYHVVVQAHTQAEIERWSGGGGDAGKDLSKRNFWMRTIPAAGCSRFQLGNAPDERQGILRYDRGAEAIPTTERAGFPLDCRDEPYEKLSPVVPWTVGPAAKGWAVGDDNYFEVGLAPPNKEPPFMYSNFARWTMGEKPMWLNFSDPSVLNLDRRPPRRWDDKAIVIPEDVGEDDWVYLLINGLNATVPPGAANRTFVSVAHPLHLHGHDFAILQQSNRPLTEENFDEVLRPNLANPPRRDVVLLPQGGFVLLAFKADNPGVWLMHCHIAYHASSGLAVQILERQKDIKRPLGWDDEISRGCANWEKFYGDPKNLWDTEYKYFQDDSGI